MKAKVILIAALIFTSCAVKNVKYTQDQVLKKDFFGIGLLYMGLKDQAIPLYESDKSNIPFDTLKIRTIPGGVGMGAFQFTTSSSKGTLDPYRIYGGRTPTPYDYLVKYRFIPTELTFRVIEETKDSYHVITNEKNGQIAIIHRAAANDLTICSFQNWETYFKSSDYMEMYNTIAKVPLYKKPNGKIASRAFIIRFKVIKIEGYWLNVVFNAEGNQNFTGWIRWRDREKLLYPFIIAFGTYRTLI